MRPATEENQVEKYLCTVLYILRIFCIIYMNMADKM